MSNDSCKEAWWPYDRILWPGTIMGKDGRPKSPDSAGCPAHKGTVDVVRRSDGAWRCVRCECDERFFEENGPIPEGHAMYTRYVKYLNGDFMDWREDDCI